MNPEDARSLLRAQGCCGHLSDDPGYVPGIEVGVVCILPLGHDLCVHEGSNAELAAELAETNVLLHGRIKEITALEERNKRDTDLAYRERNRLVAALVHMVLGRRNAPYIATGQVDPAWDAWLGRHPDADADWDSEWRWIVYLQTPAGQLSWHVHDSELLLFRVLAVHEDRAWDGHTTEQKYLRLELVR